MKKIRDTLSGAKKAVSGTISDALSKITIRDSENEERLAKKDSKDEEDISLMSDVAAVGRQEIKEKLKIVEFELDGKMFSNVHLLSQDSTNAIIAATTEAGDKTVWRFRKEYGKMNVDVEFDASALSNFIKNPIGFLHIASKAAVKQALYGLLIEPHNNFSINVDGQTVFSKDELMPMESLVQLLFPKLDADLTDLLNLLFCMITDSDHKDEHVSAKPFNRNYDKELRGFPVSVLHLLEKAHKLDTIGMLGAYDMMEKLPGELQSELLQNPYALCSPNLAEKYPRHAKKLETLRDYQIAMSVRDCSVIITFQEIDPDNLPPYKVYHTQGSSSSTLSQHGLEYEIRDPVDERYLCSNSVGTILFGRGTKKQPHTKKAFAYNVRLTDLDVKPVQNIEKNAARIMKALQFVREKKKELKKEKRPCLERESSYQASSLVFGQ